MKQFLSRQTSLPVGERYFANRVRSIPSEEWPNTPAVTFHDYFEMELFFAGEGFVSINGTDYRIDRGVCYLTTPWDMRLYQADPGVPLELFNLKLTDEMLSADVKAMLFQEKKPFVCRLPESMLPLFESHLNLIQSAAYKKVSFFDDKTENDRYIRALIDLIVLTFVSCRRQASKQECEPVPGETDTRIAKLIRWVDRHYSEKITTADAAREAELNYQYFGGYFRRNVNMTFQTYLARYRIFKAVELIHTTRLSLKQISYKVGFASNAHFSRVFKQVTGETPTDFRRIHIKSRNNQ